MENKIKNCVYCLHMDRYYTKDVRHFHAEKCGWCSAKKQTVNVSDACNDYAPKRKRRSKRMLQSALNDILTELSEIRSCLEAEQHENQEL